MSFPSKLGEAETSIFAVMTQMANEYQAINLSQGFPDFDVAPELIDFVTYYMKKGFNQYAPMAGVEPLRKSISKKSVSFQGVCYDPDTEITVTSGATQAIATAIATLVHAGDEVIVFEPAYDSYIPLVEVQGGKAVSIELKAPAFKPDWDEVTRAVTEKTRAIIINTPHNPCGSVLTSEDLLALAEIVKKNDLYVISDEVYEHIVFDDNEHLSVGSLPDLYERTFVISSFGKTFHTTGWKCGYCMAPAELTKEFRKVHQFIVYSVNTPVQLAYAQYMEDEENYLKVAKMYEKKRNLITKALQGSQFQLTPASGSYFQLLDFSKVFKDTGIELAQKLVKENGVALIPLEPFYRDFIAPPYIRVCFAKHDETLKSGVRCLIK
jgi:methionine aminotransferase